MALVAEDLKDELITALDNIDYENIEPEERAAEGNKVMGNVISDYFKNNAEITFSWVAQDPQGVPDPVTTTKGEMLSLPKDFLTPSLKDNNLAAMAALETKLQIGLVPISYNVTEAGFVTSAQVMVALPVLNINMSETDDRQIAFTDLANSLVDWMKTVIPIVPCLGIHGVYINGVATPTKIE